MKSNVIEIKSLGKQFGGLRAVDNINISVEKGDIFGLIGPNGAGKTTIFNLITGIYKPTDGSITFSNIDISGKKPYTIAQMGIARTFQNIRLFSELTVFQNVLTACQGRVSYGLLSAILRVGTFKKQENGIIELAKNIVHSVGLTEYENSKARNLPYGLQRRLEIGRALAVDPKLLLLDEPAAGMNEEESYQLVKLIRDIKNSYDITIIVIDHHMDVIMDICNRIAVLNFGQMIAEGAPDEIQKNPSVIEAYLGVEEE